MMLGGFIYSSMSPGEWLWFLEPWVWLFFLTFTTGLTEAFMHWKYAEKITYQEWEGIPC